MTTDAKAKMQISLPDAVQRIVGALALGHLEDAEKVSRSILKVLPQNVDALHLLGITLQRLGHLDQAIDWVQKAVLVAPNSGAILANLCEMQRQRGDLTAAIATGKRAVIAAPRLALAQCNLGVALYDNGDLDQAMAAQQKALTLEPNLTTALNNIGSILRMQDDLASAEQHYRRVLAIDPAHPEAGTNLVSIFLEQDMADKALVVAAQLLKTIPKVAELHRGIGRAFLQQENLDHAERGFRQALALNPTMTESMLGLAEVFQKKNHAGLAFEMAQKAAALDPTSAYAFQQMGQCQADLGNITQAFAHLEQALSLDPDFVPALLSRGYLHMENGEMQTAHQDFARVAQIKPGSVEYLFASVRIDKIKPGDPRIAQLEEQVGQVATFRSSKAIAVHYSLAKCYDDLGRHDDAFEQYSLGGAQKRAVVRYDADAFDRKVDAIIATFDRAMIDKLRSAAVNSAQPIFVLGMPRSGTTLTESIIASHPMVFGAGELNHMHRMFPTDTDDDLARFAAFLAGPDAPITGQAKAYLDLLDTHAPGSARITDKMPANFMYLGLIAAVMPHAKIVHVARDAVDTCVSCFTRLFERSQYHSYDQVELARYYNSYFRLMRHWAAVLPAGSFHTISYEALVDNPEEQARALIAYCGLEWDPACLEFHTAKRRVRTASVTQVRSPMYATSVAKWRQYERHLAPLLATLNPAARS